MSLFAPEVRVRNANERDISGVVQQTYFKLRGVVVEVSILPRKEVANDVIDEALHILEQNMKDLYETSVWGWDKKKKLAEMNDDSARFLLVSESGSKRLIAFSHFRFEMEADKAVLYCYEMQVARNFQRLGLGGYLIKCLELIALKSQMEKILLTVFPHNRSGLQFYSKMKFKVDVSSPWELGESRADYYILSLELQQQQHEL